MALLNFNASQVQPDQGRFAIPAAWYNVMVDQTELKPTSEGDGLYLETRYKVLDGAYKDQTIYSRFNLKNASAQAQEIGHKQLSALAHAVGVLMVQDSAQLHNIPLKVKVKIRAARGDYEESNEISAWKNINEAVPTSPSAAAATPTFPTPATAAAASFPAAGAPPMTFPAATAPATVAQAPAPAALAASPVLVQVQGAQYTIEQCRATNPPWTDDQLVQNGIARWETPSAPAAPVASAPAVTGSFAAQPWANGTPAQGHQATTNAPAQTYTPDPAVALPPGAAPQAVTPPWHQPQQ